MTSLMRSESVPTTPPPRLTIVTPVLNGRAFLAKAVASVESQIALPGHFAKPGQVPSGPVEHIIMDGGSRDGTFELAREYAHRRPDVVSHLVSRKDRGQSEAINNGFALARGRWGAWLNADDWYECGALAAWLDAIERHEASADLIIGRARIIDARGSVVFAPDPPDPLNLANLLSLTSQWFNGRLILQPEACFRLATFREAGQLSITNAYSMDHELWVRMLANDARPMTIPTLIASQLSHAGQRTADKAASVRCIHESTVREFARLTDRLGSAAPRVKLELDRIERKLGLFDDLSRYWSPVPDVWPAIVRSPPKATAGADHAADVIWRHVRRLWWRTSTRTIAQLEGGTYFNHEGLPLYHSPDEDHDTSLGRHVGRAQRSWIAPDAREQGAFDVVAASGVVGTRQSPSASLSHWWSLVKPGGALVITHEPVPMSDSGLSKVMASVRQRMLGQLAADHDRVLSAAEDAALQRCVRGDEPGLPVEVEALMSPIAGPPQHRAAHGAWSTHPLLNFLREDGSSVDGGAWAAWLWRKPKK